MTMVGGGGGRGEEVVVVVKGRRPRSGYAALGKEVARCLTGEFHVG
jgi:hypothetical protein